MKKTWLGLLVLFLLVCQLSHAGESHERIPNKTLLIGGDLYLDVYEDGKMSGAKIIA